MLLAKKTGWSLKVLARWASFPSGSLLKSFEGISMRIFRNATIAVAACWLASTGLWAQTVSTAQITGAVRDASGLAVPGVEVRVTQTGTGQVRTTTTGAD